jgi:hypothetical protein
LTGYKEGSSQCDCLRAPREQAESILHWQVVTHEREVTKCGDLLLLLCQDMHVAHGCKTTGNLLRRWGSQYRRAGTLWAAPSTAPSTGPDQQSGEQEQQPTPFGGTQKQNKTKGLQKEQDSKQDSCISIDESVLLPRCKQAAMVIRMS